MDTFSFKLKSDVKIGLGILKGFTDEVSPLNILKPLILCDENLLTSEYFIGLKPIFENFSKNGLFYVLKLNGEPSYELLSSLMDEIDLDIFDGVVSLGGGSTMDIGKGLALLAKNRCEPKKLKGFPSGLNLPLPHVTIPSVLGSGSEASFNAVFVDEKENKKLGINSANNFPSMVLVDPNLSMSAPLPAVLSSALDCMVHCVDSFGSLKSSPVSKMFSVEGFKNIWNFLTEEDIQKPISRMKLAQASIHGIYALMNSGDGPTNGFAYYFGVNNKIPHGMAGGMFLKDVMLWNFENGYNEYSRLLYNTSTDSMESFFQKYDALLVDAKIPTLENYGYKLSDCKNLSEVVSSALSGSFSGNPISFNIDSAKWVLEQQFR